MTGWRIRHDLSGDVPFFAAVLVIAGGVIAIGVRGVVDVILHHHSLKQRDPAGRVSHRH